MTFNIKRLMSRVLACATILCGGLAHAATAGPGTWSAQQTWGSDSVNGGNLTGFFYWPSSEPMVAGKRALVLVLHGCQQTAANDVVNGSDGGYNWKTTADKYGAVVLAPNAPGNVYANHCWDYANTAHSRTGGGHDKVLLDLINRFADDPQYAIDRNQIYVTGLSSGGGQTMVMGCLAPDVFAGIGINAGPTPGTTTLQIGAVPQGYSATTAASRCKAMAGANADKFSTQIAGAIWGTLDYTVAQAYGPIATAAFRQIYGGSYTKSTLTVAGGGSNVQYTDANGKVRTHEITVSGMSHAWPAGPGGQGTNYVDNNKVDYPEFVMDYWFKNNLRVSAVAAPVMGACAANAVSATSATITGSATGPADISKYTVVLSGPTPVNDAAAGSGASFSKTYNLGNGYYSGTVSATDSNGQSSAACTIAQFLVGTAPAIEAPSGLTASAPTATSVSLKWNAVSGASGYNVYQNGAKVTATPISSTSYTASGLSASTSYSFAVSAVGASGESALTAPVTASTTSGFSCSATTASNYAHVQAGRAHTSGGYALANGSNQVLGLYNIFFTKTLAQTAAGYYVVGNCP